MSHTIVWLRRDWRLHDHAALSAALAHSGNVQPVFIFDTKILARFANPADRRLKFLAQVVCDIHRQLAAQGGGLLVLHGDACEAMPRLTAATGAGRIVCAEDFEPQAIVRDAAVKAALANTAAFEQVVDQLIFHAGHIVKSDGTPYHVFTPFSKAWRAALRADSFAERNVDLRGRLADASAIAAAASKAGLRVLDASAGPEALLEMIGYRDGGPDEWSTTDVRARLERFITDRLEGYKESRDAVWDDGTSKLSPYLRFGLVSVRECARLAAERPGKGADTWLNELIWREFYAMILFRFPEVVEWEFQEQYRGLRWANDAHLLAAWQQGKTGYPIVDAAMRQLSHTGWMHNRARMVVASFFTKDLHLNWRLGEEHFAQLLMDYDLASNNGGWQWAASTGTDAQPYFRIFNPELQSRRFDPQAIYIKRFVPELAHLAAEDIHRLHAGESLLRPATYPARVVDHHAQKATAIAMFKEAAA